MMIENPTFWQSVIAVLWSVVVALLAYIKHTGDRKMEILETLIAQKADRADVDRHRDSIEEFYKENASIRKDMNGGFQRITELFHSGHIQIMTELAKKADRA